MMELFAGVLHDGGHRALQPGQCGADRQARDPRHQKHQIRVVYSGLSGVILLNPDPSLSFNENNLSEGKSLILVQV